MKFKTTSGSSQRWSFAETLLNSMPEDGGLFVPEELPQCDWKRLRDFSFQSIAYFVLHPFLKDEFSDDKIKNMIEEAFYFPIPLNKISEKISLLELFHGPTAAFKDVAAQFLSVMLQNIVKNQKIILVATSGDTGGAVAAAFSNKKNFKVAVLFPEFGVSPFQKHQLSCWGDNILSLAVKGSFDDCQGIVKSMLMNTSLSERFQFMSANSISLGRLLPQICYYAASSIWWWNEKGEKAHYFIPTGNMGNAVAAFWAQAMGFPIEFIHMACNENDALPQYYLTRQWKPKKSVTTLANAMDVGNPSNWYRLHYLYPESEQLFKQSQATRVSNDEIRSTIQNVYKQNGVIICPHTATAWFLAEKHKGNSIVVATAHPSKFVEVIEPLVGHTLQQPESFKSILQKPSQYKNVSPDINNCMKEIEKFLQN